MTQKTTKNLKTTRPRPPKERTRANPPHPAPAAAVPAEGAPAAAKPLPPGVALRRVQDALMNEIAAEAGPLVQRLQRMDGALEGVKRAEEAREQARGTPEEVAAVENYGLALVGLVLAARPRDANGNPSPSRP